MQDRWEHTGRWVLKSTMEMLGLHGSTQSGVRGGQEPQIPGLRREERQHVIPAQFNGQGRVRAGNWLFLGPCWFSQGKAPCYKQTNKIGYQEPLTLGFGSQGHMCPPPLSGRELSVGTFPTSADTVLGTNKLLKIHLLKYMVNASVKLAMCSALDLFLPLSNEMKLNSHEVNT